MRTEQSSRRSASSVPLYEHAVRLFILILAQTGFYFCFTTEYRLSAGISVYLFTLAACLFYLLIFSLKSHAILFAVSVALSGLFVWFHADQIVQSWLLLLSRLFDACGGSLPEILTQLLREDGATVSYALCTVMYLSTVLASYAVTRGDSLLLLSLSSVPVLFPGLFFSLAGNTVSFFAILTAWFAFALFKKYGGLLSASVSEDTDLRLKVRPDRIRKRTSLRSLSAVTAFLMAFAVFGVSSLILPEKGYERPDIWNQLRRSIYDSKLGDLIGRPNDGLSHGRFRDLSEIRFTGDAALKARVSDRLSLYIRNFAGTVYTDVGWEEVPGSIYESYVIGGSPLLMHMRADQTLGSGEQSYLLSVKSDRRAIDSLILPQGLMTGTDDLNGTRYVNDTGIETVGTEGIAGYSVYALQLRTAFANLSVPRSADVKNAVREGYESAVRDMYGRTSLSEETEHYLRYIFDYYTALPEETEEAGRLLCEQFGITGVSGGTLNLADVCSSLQRMFNSYCRYSYDPPAIPQEADFSTYFMNESRQGYCIHFATTAAVMLRSLGIPARYAEGYIIVQADYLKDTDAEGYFTIEDTHAHAWVEVFDPLQLEWIPVEMTPNEGEDTVSGGLSPTLTPPPTATPEPSKAPDTEEGEEEVLTPEPDLTPEPEDEPDDSLETEDDSDPSEVEPEQEFAEQGEDPGEISDEPEDNVDGEGTEGEGPGPVSVSMTGGDGNSIGTDERGIKRSVLLSILIPLLLILSGGSLYYLNRRRREERFSGKASEAVLAAAKECDEFIRLSKGMSIRSDEIPDEYAERISGELPFIIASDIRTVYGSAQKILFSSESAGMSERNAVMKAHASLRGKTLGKADLLRKLYLVLRYPSLTEQSGKKTVS